MWVTGWWVHVDFHPKFVGLTGSVDDIAGVCDATGLVIGLMPHPERFVDAIQHPAWKRGAAMSEPGAGLKVFQNAVKHVSHSVGVGV